MQCNHIMVDLETMGTGSNAAIIAIGAVGINDDGIIDNKFYCVVDLASAVEHGGVVDASTEKWWSEQSPEARVILDDPNVERVTIEQALFAFAKWFRDIGATRHKTQVWGNGSDFDNVILMNAYKRLDLDQPWSPFNNRCYRTLKNLAPSLVIERIGTHHNALNDAESQAAHMIHIFDRIADVQDRSVS